MKIQAVNNAVFVIREKEEAEKSGLLIPGKDKLKPNQGKILSVGDLVGDKKIKGAKNKQCLFHSGVGFTIQFEGTDYLVLEAQNVIAILENDSSSK